MDGGGTEFAGVFAASERESTNSLLGEEVRLVRLPLWFLDGRMVISWRGDIGIW